MRYRVRLVRVANWAISVHDSYFVRSYIPQAYIEEIIMGEPRIGWDPQERYKDIMIAEQYDASRFGSVPGRIFNYLEKKNIRRAYADSS